MMSFSRNNYQKVETNFEFESVDEFLSAYAKLFLSTRTFGVFVNSFSPFHMARVSLKEDLASIKLSQIQICRKRHY